MGDVRRPIGAHVTCQAIVLIFLPALGQEHLARLFSLFNLIPWRMTFPALLPVMVRILAFLHSDVVRIVTGDTAKFIVALGTLVASAQDHLFHMIDGFGILAGLPAIYKYRPEQIKRHPRAIIEQAPAAANDANFSLQVTLLANGFRQVWHKFSRVDNG